MFQSYIFNVSNEPIMTIFQNLVTYFSTEIENPDCVTFDIKLIND